MWVMCFSEESPNKGGEKSKGWARGKDSGAKEGPTDWEGQQYPQGRKKSGEEQKHTKDKGTFQRTGWSSEDKESGTPLKSPLPGALT